MSKKCAFIRSNKPGEEKCPFGLPIDQACKYAGDAIYNMTPLEMVGDKEKTKKANQRVYIYTKTDKRCPFAVSIMDKYDAVNCNYGDNAEGVPMTHALVGSPLYPRQFTGFGLENLNAFPLGFYNDHMVDRNLFTGLFSLIGEVAPSIIKNAIITKSHDLWNKIANGDILFPKEQDQLNVILRELKEFFNE